MAGQERMRSKSLLLMTVCCCYASLGLINLPANAFLYHQLQPAASVSSPDFNSNYSSRYSGFLNHNHQYQLGRQQQTLPVTVASRQQRQEHHHQAPRESLSNYLHEHTDAEQNCPSVCDCNTKAQIVDCSNRNLNRVPTGFPKDTKRIRLERNNISELNALAFQGLKRLQRIDLSNNNLAKIDSQAFSGGLQSLNSLILYSNKLSQLPLNLFSELGQLQLLLLNANSLRCISKELFQPLTNLSLLSLYDNNIETLANGTFDGLRSIKTIHLGKNPLICDCNLRWLFNYLRTSPNIETSEAACALPERNQGKKLKELTEHKFECKVGEQNRSNHIVAQCAATAATAVAPNQQPPGDDYSPCPSGCVCDGSIVDCSPASQSESRAGMFELPDIPEDVPVYVARMKINDNRIKRIRQTGLFRRLANSQKLDLGNNKIVDIEDNAINGLLSSSAGSAASPSKPERVVFVLIENENCQANSGASSTLERLSQQPEDPCASAPRINAPTFDSPCYNGGTCKANPPGHPSASNYSCSCPPGFAGPLCEINIDDCAEHQCQNGAMCVDGLNSYKCICRDPTTTGEFCEQLNQPTISSTSSIAPVALPMIASAGPAAMNQLIPEQHILQPREQSQQEAGPRNQQILARSADFMRILDEPQSSGSSCKRVTQRRYFDDGNGCQSVRLLKISECFGTCDASSKSQAGCCAPAKVKRRRIRMQCSDGASYVKTVDLTKKCACSSECRAPDQSRQQLAFANSFNATQEDQILQITRLDAVD